MPKQASCTEQASKFAMLRKLSIIHDAARELEAIERADARAKQSHLMRELGVMH